MFEIKLGPTEKWFRSNPALGITRVTIDTQKWVKGDKEYIIVHQDGLYNIYWRSAFPIVSGTDGMRLMQEWSDLLPQPVYDLLSIRCAIEELDIAPEEEVL